jgi:hypothetical protein
MSFFFDTDTDTDTDSDPENVMNMTPLSFSA